MVALDSAAAPAKLQRKLRKRWAKKCARFITKKDRKHKLKRVEGELRKAWQEHGKATKVGDLRAMVGNALGLAVDDGEYRAHSPASTETPKAAAVHHCRRQPP